MANLAYISLGSNLGDRAACLRAATGQLQELGSLKAESGFYETEPVEFRDQPWFLNCVVALEAATGRRIWHFQAVHHDLWDRDLPCPPALVTVNHNGRRVDAVAQMTKFSRLFLLDRETGKPLFPVEERPVPASDVPGERAWPTQPFPLKPPSLTRQVFTEDQLTNISPQAHAHALEVFSKVRSGNAWLPPSEQGTIVFPGFDGGG